MLRALKNGYKKIGITEESHSKCVKLSRKYSISLSIFASLVVASYYIDITGGTMRADSGRTQPDIISKQ